MPRRKKRDGEKNEEEREREKKREGTEYDEERTGGREKGGKIEGEKETGRYGDGERRRRTNKSRCSFNPTTTTTAALHIIPV